MSESRNVSNLMLGVIVMVPWLPPSSSPQGTSIGVLILHHFVVEDCLWSVRTRGNVRQVGGHSLSDSDLKKCQQKMAKIAGNGQTI